MLHGRELKNRELPVEVAKQWVVKLRGGNQGLEDEKASMKNELVQFREQAEATKVEDQQVREDLQSAKKRVENLTAQVCVCEPAKEDEDRKATCGRVFSRLGTVVKQVKMARLVGLWVLKKESDGQVAEKVALKKVKNARKRKRIFPSSLGEHGH